VISRFCRNIGKKERASLSAEREDSNQMQNRASIGRSGWLERCEARIVLAPLRGGDSRGHHTGRGTVRGSLSEKKKVQSTASCLSSRAKRNPNHNYCYCSGARELSQRLEKENQGWEYLSLGSMV